MPARYAVYFAPPPESRLWRLASAWLGRDAYTGETLPPPVIRGLPRVEVRAMTEAPRRYGFHATLKAPFELAVGATERSLVQVAESFCRRQRVISAPMQVRQLGEFLALLPTSRFLPLERLAAGCVETFEPFRAPLSEFDRARYRRGGLSARQEYMLDRWGYPQVMEEFRFHMSLTGKLDQITLEETREKLARLFHELLIEPLRVDAICLFRQPDRGQPFEVMERFPFAQELHTQASNGY